MLVESGDNPVNRFLDGRTESESERVLRVRPEGGGTGLAESHRADLQVFVYDLAAHTHTDTQRHDILT